MALLDQLPVTDVLAWPHGMHAWRKASLLCRRAQPSLYRLCSLSAVGFMVYYEGARFPVHTVGRSSGLNLTGSDRLM